MEKHCHTISTEYGIQNKSAKFHLPVPGALGSHQNYDMLEKHVFFFRKTYDNCGSLHLATSDRIISRTFLFSYLTWKRLSVRHECTLVVNYTNVYLFHHTKKNLVADFFLLAQQCYYWLMPPSCGSFFKSFFVFSEFAAQKSKGTQEDDNKSGEKYLLAEPVHRETATTEEK